MYTNELWMRAYPAIALTDKYVFLPKFLPNILALCARFEIFGSQGR